MSVLHTRGTVDRGNIKLEYMDDWNMDLSHGAPTPSGARTHHAFDLNADWATFDTSALI
jgi:hypothetical protein